MIFNIGYLILVAALVIAAFGMFSGLWGGFKRQSNFAAASFHAVYAVTGLVTVASIILWYGLLADRFEVAYVWNHSERALPVFYKFAALWGGQAGSLLFWALVLGGFSTAVALTYRNKIATLMPFVNAILLMNSGFFLVLMVFSANPFEQYGFAPADGQGLNPLLQNYWMVIHPVMLFVGYVGMAVPFAFGVAALLSKQLGNLWVRIIRRWTLIPWMFLSAGIIMGSQWAYMELGWGGYWAWDPVENVSFLPWITATAFLHSLIIQDRRGMLKVWNMVLIWATYFLVILGTFTTRSGILASVHSFARSDVGPYFLVYLTIMAFGFLWLLFDRMSLLHSENEIDSVMSREAAFLANNWLFTGIAFATLWGTFFPLFSEIITGQRISVAAPWFNKVVGPLFLLLFLAMGIGPLLGWRRTSKEMLIKQFTWPTVVAIVFAVALFFLGHSGIYPVIGLALCVFVTATIVQEFVRGIIARRTTTGENPVTAMWSLTRRNGQRYGGYIVHLGIVLIGVAVIGNEFYQQTTNVTLGYGESVQLGRYIFIYDDLVPERAVNRDEYTAYLSVVNTENGDIVGALKPKRNVYFKTPDMPTSEVGLIMRPTEDIYVVLNGWDPTTATFSIFLNPLTMWMWVGGIVIVFGTLICVWPTPRRREVRVTVAQPTVGAAAD